MPIVMKNAFRNIIQSYFILIASIIIILAIDIVFLFSDISKDALKEEAKIILLIINNLMFIIMAIMAGKYFYLKVAYDQVFKQHHELILLYDAVTKEYYKIMPQTHSNLQFPYSS